MRVLSIDPGSEKSGYVLLEDGVPKHWGWEENFYVLTGCVIGSYGGDRQLVIEDVGNYGMAVGRDVFETVKWMGRFDQADGRNAIFIPRPTIKTHLCGKATAKDANVRQALIDRYGGDAVAIGGKRCKPCHGNGWNGRDHIPCPYCMSNPNSSVGPFTGTGYETPKGVLHGLSGHCWSALAVGVTYLDSRKDGVE